MDRDPDQVATWRSDDGGAVANEEPSRSLLGPAALVGIGVAGSLYQAFTLGHPVLAHAGVLWRVP